jgi:hypothetical protein
MLPLFADLSRDEQDYVIELWRRVPRVERSSVRPQWPQRVLTDWGPQPPSRARRGAVSRPVRRSS